MYHCKTIIQNLVPESVGEVAPSMEMVGTLRENAVLAILTMMMIVGGPGPDDGRCRTSW